MEDMTLQEIYNKYPNEDFLCFSGLEEAVVGVAEDLEPMVLIISNSKAVDILIKRDGMDFEEALEFHCFNTIGAYVGPRTPVFREDVFAELGYPIEIQDSWEDKRKYRL